MKMSESPAECSTRVVQEYLLTNTIPQHYGRNQKAHLRLVVQRYFLKNGKMYRDIQKYSETPLLVIHKDETELKQEILRDMHIEPDGRHMGVNRMMNKIKEKYFWIGFTHDVALYLRGCDLCKNKQRRSIEELRKCKHEKKYGPRYEEQKERDKESRRIKTEMKNLTDNPSETYIVVNIDKNAAEMESGVIFDEEKNQYVIKGSDGEKLPMESDGGLTTVVNVGDVIQSADPTSQQRTVHIDEYLKMGKMPKGYVTKNQRGGLQLAAKKFTLIGNQLYRKPDPHHQWDFRKVVHEIYPEKKLKIIIKAHIDEDGIHLGINKMTKEISAKYYWKGVTDDLHRFVRVCQSCSGKQHRTFDEKKTIDKIKHHRIKEAKKQKMDDANIIRSLNLNMKDKVLVVNAEHHQLGTSVSKDLPHTSAVHIAPHIALTNLSTLTGKTVATCGSNVDSLKSTNILSGSNALGSHSLLKHSFETFKPGASFPLIFLSPPVGGDSTTKKRTHSSTSATTKETVNKSCNNSHKSRGSTCYGSNYKTNSISEGCIVVKSANDTCSIKKESDEHACVVSENTTSSNNITGYRDIPTSGIGKDGFVTVLVSKKGGNVDVKIENLDVPVDQAILKKPVDKTRDDHDISNNFSRTHSGNIHKTPAQVSSSNGKIHVPSDYVANNDVLTVLVSKKGGNVDVKIKDPPKHNHASNKQQLGHVNSTKGDISTDSRKTFKSLLNNSSMPELRKNPIPKNDYRSSIDTSMLGQLDGYTCSMNENDETNGTTVLSEASLCSLLSKDAGGVTCNIYVSDDEISTSSGVDTTVPVNTNYATGNISETSKNNMDKTPSDVQKHIHNTTSFTGAKVRSREIEQYLKDGSYDPTYTWNQKFSLIKAATKYMYDESTDILYRRPDHNWRKNIGLVEVIHDDCQSRKLDIINSLHVPIQVVGQCNMHLGINKTLDMVRQRFFWRGMSQDVNTHISKCRCQRAGVTVKPPEAARSGAPEGPQQEIHKRKAEQSEGSIPPSQSDQTPVKRRRRRRAKDNVDDGADQESSTPQGSCINQLEALIKPAQELQQSKEYTDTSEGSSVQQATSPITDPLKDTVDTEETQNETSNQSIYSSAESVKVKCSKLNTPSANIVENEHQTENTTKQTEITKQTSSSNDDASKESDKLSSSATKNKHVKLSMVARSSQQLKSHKNSKLDMSSSVESPSSDVTGPNNSDATSNHNTTTKSILVNIKPSGSSTTTILSHTPVRSLPEPEMKISKSLFFSSIFNVEKKYPKPAESELPKTHTTLPYTHVDTNKPKPAESPLTEPQTVLPSTQQKRQSEANKQCRMSKRQSEANTECRKSKRQSEANKRCRMAKRNKKKSTYLASYLAYTDTRVPSANVGSESTGQTTGIKSKVGVDAESESREKAMVNKHKVGVETTGSDSEPDVNITGSETGDTTVDNLSTVVSPGSRPVMHNVEEAEPVKLKRRSQPKEILKQKAATVKQRVEGTMVRAKEALIHQAKGTMEWTEEIVKQRDEGTIEMAKGTMEETVKLKADGTVEEGVGETADLFADGSMEREIDDNDDQGSEVDVDMCEDEEDDGTMDTSEDGEIAIYEKVSECDMCEKLQSDPRLLEVHSRIHRNKMQACSECNEKFYTSFHLVLHCESRHKQTPIYKCDICKAKFGSKMYLRNEILLGGILSFYSCVMCMPKFVIDM